MKRIAVLFALPIEAKPFLKHITDLRMDLESQTRYTGFIDGKAISVRVSGIGRERAGRAAQLCLDKDNPSAILAAGFAGGLLAQLTPGSISVSQSLFCFDRAGEHIYRSDKRLLEHAGTLRDLGSVHFGPTITADKIIASPQEKKALFSSKEYVSVDMESAAIADVAENGDVPFIAIRSITDAVDDLLPIPIIQNMDPDGRINLKGLAGAFIRQPALVVDAYRMMSKARLASANLALFLKSFIEKLSFE